VAKNLESREVALSEILGKSMRLRALIGWSFGLVACWLAVSLPAQQQAQTATANQTATTNIVVQVSRVLVPVIVRDANGRAVSDLKKEDFQVFDNDKPRALSGFMVERWVAPPAGHSQASEGGGSVPSATAQPFVPRRFVVFLFDDLHLMPEDLVPAKKASVSALVEELGDRDIGAVVSTSGKVNSGLTQDRSKLKEAIASLQPRGLLRIGGHDCPNIGYYQANLIESRHDGPATADALQQTYSCNPSLNPQYDQNVAENMMESAVNRTLMVGNQDILTTYAAILEFVRRVAELPGQRTVILVSPGFITFAPEALHEESRVIDLAAQSNVTISALDTRGVYVTQVTASENTVGRSVNMVGSLRRSEMSAAEGTMGALADGTGGTFFHNSNDLAAGFRELTAMPECVYLLELPVDAVKMDGSYHRLKVKVDRAAVDVQARRGYFIPKPPKEPKKAK
jgi:VWFA-related protein